ncbi:hypothetical protein ACF0H5_023701 [Mactra antiquata]
MSYSSRKKNKPEPKQFRWAAEFLAGPGGYLEMAVIESDWFSNFDDAKDHANEYAQKQVEEFPFSHGKITKLVVEDKEGVIFETLVNAKVVERR